MTYPARREKQKAGKGGCRVVELLIGLAALSAVIVWICCAVSE